MVEKARKEADRRKPISTAARAIQWVAAFLVSMVVVMEFWERISERLTPEQAALKEAEVKAFTSLGADLEAVKDAIMATAAFNNILEEQQNSTMETISNNQTKISETLSVLSATTELRIKSLETSKHEHSGN